MSENKTEDIKEVIHVLVPGLSKEDITIDVSEKRLSITSRKKIIDNKEYEYKHWIGLLEEDDVSNIEASVKDGILRLSIPKLVKQIKTIKIL